MLSHHKSTLSTPSSDAFHWKPISYFDKESASQTIGYGFDNILTQQPRNVGTVSYLGQDVKESCDEYMT